MQDTLYGLLEREYGVKTTNLVNPVVSQIAATITQFLKLNPQRVAFTFINLGGNSCYISPRNDVSGTNGIYLAPNGGTAALIWREDFDLVGMDWYGIAPGGAVNVHCLEVNILSSRK